ncbi:MAG: hypothetical protein ACOY90_14865 [Candidatus Zhuqueibacterota bacterium]
MKRNLFLLFFFLFPNIILSQQYVQLSQDATSLFGLKNFQIFVEDLDNSIKLLGINQNTLKTDIELKLRSSGINPIPNMENKYPESKIPILYIKVQITKFQPANYTEPIFFFYISLELLQSVILDRNIEKSNFSNVKLFHVATWRENIQGYVGSSNLSQIRDVAKDLVDKFSNDYLMMNSKK